MTADLSIITPNSDLDESNHMGPLIDQEAVGTYLDAIEKIKCEGGIFVVEGGVLQGDEYQGGCYVKHLFVIVF